MPIDFKPIDVRITAKDIVYLEHILKWLQNTKKYGPERLLLEVNFCIITYHTVSGDSLDPNYKGYDHRELEYHVAVYDPFEDDYLADAADRSLGDALEDLERKLKKEIPEYEIERDTKKE